jgi:hypothetical protein
VRRPDIVTSLARFGLIALVLVVAVIGHWAIPSAIGLLPKLVAIALLELAVLWLFGRWTRRRADTTPRR